MVVLVAGGCAGGEQASVKVTEQAVSTCLVVDAAGDAMLSNPPMTQTFGTKPILRVGGKDESLVKFAMPALPANAVVDSATLELYVSDSASSAPINVHRALAPWTENTVSYASFAQQFEPTVVGAFVAFGSSGQKSIDLTALTRSWLAGTPNHGVLLESAANGKTILVSREGGTAAQTPRLRVCYSEPTTNHCAPDPCEHGLCTDTGTGYTCACDAGYTGATCGTLIDNCAAEPCANGGTCANQVGGYACTCAAGYEGANCESIVNNCAQAPCQNGGVCTNAIGAYSCACPPGYDGTNCEHLIDHCAGDPCQHGSCSNSASGYTCACDVGYSGDHCEIDIDDCSTNPCQSGGTCIDGVASFTCACPVDRGGTYCELDLNRCSQHPCLNGASCTNVGGGYTCGCAPGYTGTNCEVDINECAGHPCENDGVCVDDVAGFACQCAAGYAGPTCAIEIDECASAPCQHGGTCTDQVAGFTCACPTGYAGATCEVDLCAGATMAIGDTVSATLAPNETITRTFCAAAGQHVGVAAGVATGFTLLDLAVTDPANSTETIPGSTSVGKELTATSAGVYRVTVKNRYVNTATVSLSVFAVAPDITANVTPGMGTATITLTTGYQHARFEFAATAGQPVWVAVTALNPFTTTGRLVRPDGTSLIVSPANISDVLAIDQTGTWVYVLDTPGTYSMFVAAIPPDPTAALVVDGGAIPLSLIYRQAAHYTFTGAAGDIVNFQWQQSYVLGQLQIWTPSGAALYAVQVTGNSGAARFVLPETGTYRIDHKLTSVDGQVTDSVSTGFAPQAVEVFYNTTTSYFVGLLQPTQVSFDVPAGALFRLSHSPCGSITLIDPANVSRTQFCSAIEVYAPDGGTYHFAAPVSGNVSATITDIVTTPLSIGVPQSVSGAYKLRFPVIAGQSYKATGTGSALIQTGLYDSNGAAVAIPSSGNYATTFVAARTGDAILYGSAFGSGGTIQVTTP
jgi:hypothetical protein